MRQTVRLNQSENVPALSLPLSPYMVQLTQNMPKTIEQSPQTCYNYKTAILLFRGVVYCQSRMCFSGKGNI